MPVNTTLQAECNRNELILSNAHYHSTQDTYAIDLMRDIWTFERKCRILSGTLKAETERMVIVNLKSTTLNTYKDFPSYKNLILRRSGNVVQRLLVYDRVIGDLLLRTRAMRHIPEFIDVFAPSCRNSLVLLIIDLYTGEAWSKEIQLFCSVKGTADDTIFLSLLLSTSCS
ncbi:7416_t:CDS:2 [Acaulospora morrowiae]|uniref:7416_t:CDS:1 n=1 Tax=Acaulospora morrowiae TaxID=94023 RepID=A0A9N9EB46_9GLOM|nr:7416_t:CDS:2 [Acaulospora morrowiae]